MRSVSWHFVCLLFPDCLHIFSTLVCVWVWVESLILYEKSFKGYHFLVTTNFILILIFIIFFSLLLCCELLNIKLQKKRMKNITRETEIPECKGGNFFFLFYCSFYLWEEKVVMNIRKSWKKNRFKYDGIFDVSDRRIKLPTEKPD